MARTMASGPGPGPQTDLNAVGGAGQGVRSGESQVSLVSST